MFFFEVNQLFGKFKQISVWQKEQTIEVLVLGLYVIPNKLSATTYQ